MNNRWMIGSVATGDYLSGCDDRLHGDDEPQQRAQSFLLPSGQSRRRAVILVDEQRLGGQDGVGGSLRYGHRHAYVVHIRIRSEGGLACKLMKLMRNKKIDNKN